MIYLWFMGDISWYIYGLWVIYHDSTIFLPYSTWKRTPNRFRARTSKGRWSLEKFRGMRYAVLCRILWSVFWGASFGPLNLKLSEIEKKNSSKNWNHLNFEPLVPTQRNDCCGCLMSCAVPQLLPSGSTWCSPSWARVPGIPRVSALWTRGKAKNVEETLRSYTFFSFEIA